MSEIQRLKTRIIDNGIKGLETAQIRDDYEPIGDMMIRELTEAGDFVTRRVLDDDRRKSRWMIFPAGIQH